MRDGGGDLHCRISLWIGSKCRNDSSRNGPVMFLWVPDHCDVAAFNGRDGTDREECVVLFTNRESSDVVLKVQVIDVIDRIFFAGGYVTDFKPVVRALEDVGVSNDGFAVAVEPSGSLRCLIVDRIDLLDQDDGGFRLGDDLRRRQRNDLAPALSR